MVRSGTVQARGFNCVNCGAAIELRALAHTTAVACTSCGAIIDANNQTLITLQKAQLRQRIAPKIPLGSRGTWHGHTFAVIGFQRRTTEVDGEEYSWDEYLLFNPYQGFRYLTEYDGHWNDVRTVRDLPIVHAAKRPTATYGDQTFRHFQTALAKTTYVLGEFPWRVRVGDAVEASDYTAPPLLLSSESTGGETTWSMGKYIDGREIWNAFKLPGAPPSPNGVYANQPSPYTGRPTRYWTDFLGLVLLLAIVFVFREISGGREEVFKGTYRVTGGAAGEAAFVTEPFTVSKAGTVEVDLSTDVQNAWVAFDLALIDMDNGEALNVSREISYYFGRDSDGNWTEGSTSDRVRLPPVPAGQYYLRVEPEAPPEAKVVTYGLAVRRDVPHELVYGIVLVLLFIPPVLVTLRAAGFEGKRWKESDYAGGSSSDD